MMFIPQWLLAFLLMQFPFSDATGEDELKEMYRLGMELYYAEIPSSETDSTAKAFFTAILNAENKEDVLGKAKLLEVYEKLGNLNLIMEEDQDAIAAYWSALSLDKSPELEDSLFFGSNLFMAEAYYKLNKPDSAIHFFKKAERIFELMDSKNEGSRLYNSLGVYYYETGNFAQAINYFTKAKDLVIGDRDSSELDSYMKYAYFSFTSNIATALVKLKKLDSAKRAFHELVHLNINTDVTYLDLVDLHLELGEPDSAFSFLQKINSPTTRQTIGYANKVAEIYLQKRDYINARIVLQELIERHEASDEDFLEGDRNFKLGYTNRLFGRIYMEEKKYLQALTHFHRAILHFDPSFSDLNPLSNPDDHGMGFAAYALFDNLILKANTLVELASNESDGKYWEAATNTYQEAFNKVVYLNAFYDNDVARVFLGESVLPAYQKAIEQVLEKYSISPTKSLLEQAFLWAESSKSISLLAGQNEKKIKSQFGIPAALLEEENELNFKMSNLIQQLNATEDLEAGQSIQKELLDIRLKLSTLHLRFNEFPDFVNAKITGKIKNIEELQNTFLSRGKLLISVFESKTNRHLFYLDKNSLNVISRPLDKLFSEKVAHFKTSIFTAEMGERFDLRGVAHEIFKEFFTGVEENLRVYEELLIIPHGIWRDFPFDLLVNSSNEYLIENFSIGYQFSVNFLETENAKLVSMDNMLSLAPYAHPIPHSSFNDLPYSLSEIELLPGKKLIGKAATKLQFLESVGNHNILHLATHAQAVLESPYQSFIAFYPDTEDHKLYLEELQYKTFEHTDLIYLSSCESNYGEISASEGVLGISRAFAYAGCPNVITSLWKMEDLTSSYLSSKFYHYLERGNSITKSLQLAKIDLLSDPEMNQFRHPRYWAQLVYIGNPTGLQAGAKWPFVYSMLVIFALFICLFFVFQRSNGISHGK
ncbi:CHAT domain-containing protein [Lunatibacter salilacus]|uniref:CHAT domain-containing protein n=1 Tax=Lunatibacter salilacus TaxID=2483804 RepID=UPI00131BCB74|nr:CHAT domain-containing protein [Lunatibacter salilacus]